MPKTNYFVAIRFSPRQQLPQLRRNRFAESDDFLQRLPLRVQGGHDDPSLLRSEHDFQNVRPLSPVREVLIS